MKWEVPGQEVDQRKLGRDCGKRQIEQGGFHGS